MSQTGRSKIEDSIRRIAIVQGKTNDGVEYTMQCPVCDKQGHFRVNIVKARGTCYHCDFGRGITQESLLVDMERAFGTPDESIDVEEYKNRQVEGPTKTVSLPERFITLQRCRVSMPRTYDLVGRYLGSRARPVPMEEASALGFGVTPEHPGCLIVPMYDRYGEQVYWMSVSCLTGEKLYPDKKPGEIGKSDVLFNVNRAFGRFCMVVEGVFDAIRWVRFSVATLGTSLSQRQLEMICRHYETAFVCYDPGAEEHALDAMERIEAAGVKAYRMLVAKDPDELSAGELREAMAKSIAGKRSALFERVSSLLS